MDCLSISAGLHQRSFPAMKLTGFDIQLAGRRVRPPATRSAASCAAGNTVDYINVSPRGRRPLRWCRIARGCHRPRNFQSGHADVS
jgi:hypothetical protein